MIATHSGKALDVSGASTANAALLIQYTPHGGTNQQWQLQSVGGGYYTIAARHSGKMIDVDHALTTEGASILQWPANGGLNQQWQLRPVDGVPPDEGPSTADVIRFLEQSTWGPTPALIDHVRTVGFERFLDEQFNAAASSYPTMPLFPTTRDEATCPSGSTCVRDNYTLYQVQNRFFVNALYGDDQLRQRVAFALHQIIVVSGVDITQPSWMTPYLQILDRNAFGSYRQLLQEISLNPAMGNYLDIANNTKTIPNENYAREILQLFSLGTVRLNVDGTQQLDSTGQPIPTYTQETVNNFARVFTGWRFATAPAAGVPNYIDPMVANATNHDTLAKTLLNGRMLPAGQTAARDLSDALDNIFEDDNIGPYISKQLIQHLVTSNPSPAYVGRVAAVFNGASGSRGDLKAVVRAILLDPEARGDQKIDASYGRLRHPAQFIVNVLRAFNAKSADGTTQSDGYLNPTGGQHGDGSVPSTIGLQLLLTERHGAWQRRRPRPRVRPPDDVHGAASRQLHQHDGVFTDRRRHQLTGRHVARPGAAAGAGGQSGRTRRRAEWAAAPRHDVERDARQRRQCRDRSGGIQPVETRTNRPVSRRVVIAVSGGEIAMQLTRREFMLQAGACVGYALGAAAFVAGVQRFALINAFAQGADYRALVCVFLAGGNDSNNMVIPIGTTEYNQYSTVRTASGLAIPRDTLLPITPASLASPFGLHPNLAALHPLWNDRKLSVACNVGPLVQPLTRAEYQGGARASLPAVFAFRSGRAVANGGLGSRWPERMGRPHR